MNDEQLTVRFSLEDESLPAIFKINASGATWGSISGNIQNQEDLYLILQDKASVESVETLAETVQNNYDTLDGKIDDTESALAGQITALSDTVNINNQNINNRVDNVILNVSANTNAISTINDTISGYGNIVTHNVNEFATAAQGVLADSALQPGDNITELVNNAGYITSASLPTVNNASLTIQRNGSQVAIFTANDATDKTANILVPTQASDIGALPDTTTIADLTTQAQLDAINSGATATNVGQITTNQNAIADIRGLIPSQATTSNQLADKAFVNSSIATNTAYFVGTFNSVAELEAYSGPLTNNDYAFVATTDSVGNTLYDRYKYNADAQQWIYEYELNNSSFTAAQWASINSGITSGDVSLIQSALQPNDNISELTNDVGYITSASLPTVNNGILDIQVNGTSIGTFTANQANNTTANIVVPDSATWGNITGTLANQTDLQNALDAKQDVISDLSTIRSGAGLGATALQPNDNISELVNNVGYITGITSNDVTTALGYTPQEELVSGTNIKTVNGNSLLGSGDLTIDSGTEYGALIPLEIKQVSLGSSKGYTYSSTQVSPDDEYGWRFSSSNYGTRYLYAVNSNYYTVTFTSVDQIFGNSSYMRYIDIPIDVSGIKEASTTYPITIQLKCTSSPNGVTAFLGNVDSDNVFTPVAYARLADGGYNAHGQWGYGTFTFSSDQMTTDLGGWSYSRTSNSTSPRVTFNLNYNSSSELVEFGMNDNTGSYYYNISNQAIGGKSILDDINTLRVWLPSGVSIEDTGTYISYNYVTSTWSILNGGITSDNIKLNYDNKSLTLNSNDELQTIGVIDQNNTSTAIKTWTGTKAQYDAIVTKDADTLYNVTDDIPINTSVPYVVSRTPNNYNGIVEIWSDGYCVQTGCGTFAGGNKLDEEILISLTQSYRDTNYTAIGSKGNGTHYAVAMFALTKKSESVIRISYYDVNSETNNKASFQYNWRTEGYIN